MNLLNKLNAPICTIILWIYIVLICVNTTAFNLSTYQVLLGLSLAISFDLLFSFFEKKKFEVKIGTVIMCFGIMIICYSNYTWPYLVLITVAYLSKKIFKNKGGHYLNPNNIGIIFGLVFLAKYITITGDRWDHDYYTLVSLFVGGSLVSLIAKRLVLSYSYFVLFILVNWILVLIGVQSNIEAFVPILSPIFHIFMFLHITDPKTTSSCWKKQLMLASVIVVIEVALRRMQIRFAPFFALFLSLIILNFMSELVRKVKLKF